jgi:hypothetical protein
MQANLLSPSGGGNSNAHGIKVAKSPRNTSPKSTYLKIKNIDVFD